MTKSQLSLSPGLIPHEQAKSNAMNMPKSFSKQPGFILLPVVLAIGLVGAIAYLMNYEGAMNANSLGREIEATQAQYAAKSGMNAMQWKANQANCNGYSNINATPLGNNSYSATITPASGSPVSITATGTQANGASYSIQRDRVKVYQPPITVTLQLGTQSGKDTSIASAASNYNYGSADLTVTNGLIIFQNQLIQFDLPGLPAASKIISAQLQLHQKSGAGTANIELYRLVKPWTEGSMNGSGTANGATWKTTDGTTPWATNGGDYDKTLVAGTSVSGGSNSISSWEITPLINKWVAGTYTNEGMLLKAANVATFTFASKENTTVENRPKLVINYTCECGQPCAIKSATKKVYWTDDIANKIQRSDEDGSHVEDVITGLDRPTGLDFDTINGKIYWSNNTKIRRANLNGSDLETVYSGPNVIFDVKLDVAGGKMYWTYDITSGVGRANLNGTNSEILNTTLNRPAYLSLDLNAGYIYLTNFGSGTVARMKLNGSSVTTLVSGPTGAIGNAVDPVNGKLYWSGGATNDWIRRANLDGSTIQTIVTGLNAAQAIAYDVDHNRIYWTDALNKLVQRSDADGSNLKTIVASGLTRPRAIALLAADLVNGSSVNLSPVADTYISQTNSTTNYGTASTMLMGGDAASSRANALLFFDVLASVPVNATITSATLQLYEPTVYPGGAITIEAHKLLKSWSETSTNWTKASGWTPWDTNGGKFDSAVAASATANVGGAWVKWNLTALVQEWVDRVSADYGIALIRSAGGTGNIRATVNSRESSASQTPQLFITYTVP